MRKAIVASASATVLAGFFMVPTFNEAEARRCFTFKASHNGTDMFNPDGGAAGTARNKLLFSIESWKQQKRIKRVRIGRISTKCSEWYIKYMLPHRTCTARARVCR